MKIATLVSGGVDSSVALKLLQDQGHDITAFYLKIWLQDEAAFLGECPWEEDLRYVRAVCKQLNVPLIIIPLQKQYHERVVAYALEEVRAGRTPNPDMLCNSQVKFGAFFDAIDDSFDKVATGHYANVEEGSGIFYLKKAPDSVKDQTYFLARLSQRQLSRALFPIGAYNKDEVRRVAEKFNLPTKKRPDSQGLCFLGEINYEDFVRFHLGEKKGNIVDISTQEAIGKHNGYWFHTIGQRRGLNLPGGPWYVVGKDVKKNIVFVSHRLKMPTYERDTFEIEKLHFLVDSKHWTASDKKNLSVKVRHGAREYPCEVELLEKDLARIYLMEDKERGIASGQFAVLYDGNVCLGSGIVRE